MTDTRESRMSNAPSCPGQRPHTPGTAALARAALMLAALLALALVQVAAAQAEQPQIDVLVSGLYNPRGLAVGPDGAVYITEAGRGGDQAVKAGFYKIPFQIGRTARVTRVMPDGQWQIILDALPSVQTPDDIFGATAVTFIDDNLYVLTAAGGRDVGDPSYDNAVLQVAPDGTVTQIVNITTMNYQDPPLARLQDLRADVEGGVPFGLTALNGRLYATDGNLETVTEINLDGTTRRMVSLPASNRVLVGLTGAPDGSLWVCEYGPTPHPPGASKIDRLTLDDELTPVWTGLSEAIQIAFGPDGSAYALEFASKARVPSSGSLVRRWPDGHVETVLTGLNFATGLAIGPDGAVYIAENGHKSENGTGRVIRARLPGA
jgi:DNA-binding beta-propeller fold protein YncE